MVDIELVTAYKTWTGYSREVQHHLQITIQLNSRNMNNNSLSTKVAKHPTHQTNVQTNHRIHNFEIFIVSSKQYNQMKKCDKGKDTADGVGEKRADYV